MNKKVLGIIVGVLVLFIVVITILAYNYDEKRSISNEEVVTSIKVEKPKKDLKYDDILDKNVYKDRIITKRSNEIEYNFFNDKKSITGKVYIGDDKKLYITSDNDNDVRKISNIEFKELYYNGNEYDNDIYFYLISNDNQLYSFILSSTDIKTATIDLISTKHKVLNFVDISFDNDMEPSYTELFVLEEDGNIYEVYSKLRYKEDVKKIFDSILVFPNRTMANFYGNALEDKKGNSYIIKYIFYNKANKDYFNYDSIIIITIDNKLLTLLSEDDYGYVHEDVSRVKSMSFDKKLPFIYGNLKLELEDDRTLNFESKCSAYYCINAFDTNETDYEYGPESDVE